MGTMARNVLLVIAVALLAPFGVSVTHADDAIVLPKGVFRFILDTKNFFPADKRYDPDGNVEDVAGDYNNRPLDSNVFPSLSLLESAFGLPPGSAIIGTSLVSFEYELNHITLSAQYGLTDRLTVGLNVPYRWRKTDVKVARVDPSTATVGKSAIGAGLGAPIVPLAGGGPFGDAVPLTTEDVQNLLGNGLDVDGNGTIDVSGFGLKRVGTWSDSGIGDLEVGFRYQYLRTSDWRLAFTGGVRVPTGEADDPDHLLDRPFGAGAWALLFHLNADYTISNLWKDSRKPAVDVKGKAGPIFSPEQLKVAKKQQVPGLRLPGDVVFNFTFRYDLVLPDTEIKRISNDVNNPIGINKEEVDRDLGDIFEFDVTGRYTVLKGTTFKAGYKYAFKLEDDISGDQGFAYESLEEESDWTSHIFTVGLSYATLPLYLEKEFPIPIKATISYRNRFAGSNNALKSQYIGFQLQVIF